MDSHNFVFHKAYARKRGDISEESIQEYIEHLLHAIKVYGPNNLQCSYIFFIVTKTGECFKLDDTDPNDIYQTTSELAYSATKTRSINPQDQSVTYRRMHCSGEELEKMLDIKPPQYLPNYSLAPIPPEEQFKTTYQASYNH